MPTFLQQAFRKERRSGGKTRRAKTHKYKKRTRARKRRGYRLGKETEAIVRTTGTMAALGAAVGTMGLIGKLGKS